MTDRLGLEMRAGHLQLGSDRIAELARAGRVHWLGHAADAGEDGSRKLDQAWRVGSDAEGTCNARDRCCHWTARPCLWHWGAITSSTWR